MNDKIEKCADVFKALAHPTRLAIVCGLVKSDGCHVSIMVDRLGLSQPNISQHLTILKNAGIIEGYRKGSQICYKVVNEPVRKLIMDILRSSFE